MTDPPDPPPERVIDRTSQAEHAWVNAEADRIRDAWPEEKRALDAERREARARLGLVELHRLLLERLARISTVPAGNVEPGRGSSDRSGPPRQQELEHDPRWTEHTEVIEARYRRLHELLDEAEGLGPVAATTTMLAEEKDKLIIDEGAGLTADGVVAKLGTDIAGSSATVRRVRKAYGMSTKDGRPREPVTPEGPVRRVVIDRR